MIAIAIVTATRFHICDFQLWELASWFIKARALLVMWATFKIFPLTVALIFPLMAGPWNPSVQVLSSVKAALTQVCTSFIVWSKFEFLSPDISLIDFRISSTESCSSSTQSFMEETSLGFNPWLLESIEISEEVDFADWRVKLRAVSVRSTGFVCMKLAYFERELKQSLG